MRARGWVLWLPVLLAVVVAGPSCERIRKASQRAAERAREAAAEAGARVGVTFGDQGTGIHPQLEELVDLNGEGYRFRRDLSFPERVHTRTARETEFTRGRVFEVSELGRTSAPLEGTFDETTAVERDGSKVTVRVERMRFIPPVLEDRGKQDGEGETVEALEGAAASFVRRESGWEQSGGGGDFKLMAWGQELAPRLDRQLPGFAVVPRSPWFGSQRLLPGARVTLEDEQIALVTGMPGKGRLELRFDRVEGVGGHPCAVFQWSGEYEVKDAAGVDGVGQVIEASITEGSLWCSLLHPLVLKSQSEGLLTIESKAGVRQRLQGAFKERTAWEWVPQAGGKEAGGKE